MKAEARYLLSQHTVIKRTCLEAKKRPKNPEKPERFNKNFSYALFGEAEGKHLAETWF